MDDYICPDPIRSFSIKVRAKMDDAELDRLKELREAYDRSLLICDPITHSWRNQNLLQAIAEYLIRPLQEHEYEEKSRLNFGENENPYENPDD